MARGGGQVGGGGGKHVLGAQLRARTRARMPWRDGQDASCSSLPSISLLHGGGWRAGGAAEGERFAARRFDAPYTTPCMCVRHSALCASTPTSPHCTPWSPGDWSHSMRVPTLCAAFFTAAPECAFQRFPTSPTHRHADPVPRTASIHAVAPALCVLALARRLPLPQSGSRAGRHPAYGTTAPDGRGQRL